MIRIKPTATLLFAVLLTGWVHFTFSQPPLGQPVEYDRFLYLLLQAINASSPEALPFWLNGHLIQKLMGTSNEFKQLCLHYNAKLTTFGNSVHTPVLALNETVNHIFYDYMCSTISDNHLLGILKKIKSIDPIGFIVHLKKNSVFRKDLSPKFMECVAEYEATMNQRVRLFQMTTNDSCFDHFDESNAVMPYIFLPQRIDIPDIARAEITTEYGPLSDVSIDLFTNLATDNISRDVTSRQMYRVGIENLNDYQMHISSKLSDVQILYDISYRQTSHAICIFYKPISCRVYVYDSLSREKLDDRQMAIIEKLYPFKKMIMFRQPKTVQQREDQQYPTGAIFAIMYATMLLLNEDPAQTPIKLNTVCGDETLYMRIHILNMLANRELALLK